MGAFIRNVKVPFILFIINLLLTIPILEELNDASEPNYGGTYPLYLIPIISIISVIILIIQLKEGKNNKRLLVFLLVFNLLLVLVLAAVFVLMALAMII